MFVKDGDENDIIFFFFQQCPPFKEGATVVNEKKQFTGSLLNQEGRTHRKLPFPKVSVRLRQMGKTSTTH